MAWRDQLDIHPACEVMLETTPQDLRVLSDDIKANGLRERARLVRVGERYQVLDGRSRLDALEMIAPINVFAGNMPNRRFFEVVDLQGCDPLTLVISWNVHRRHWNESQRAMVAARIANVRQGERTDLALQGVSQDAPQEPSANLPKVDQRTAAGMLNVSTRTVTSAAKVLKEAKAPELVRAVEQGHLSASTAAQATKLSPELQQHVAKEATEGHADAALAVLKSGTAVAKPNEPSVPALDPRSWHKAKPEERRKFVEAIRPDMIVAAVGERAFYRDLTHHQGDDQPAAHPVVPAQALLADAFAAFDAASQEFDIVVTKLLASARPAIEVTGEIEITEATDRDSAANVLRRAKRIHDVNAVLEELGRLERDPTGASEARDIRQAAEIRLGHLLIETERAGLRVAAETKEGTRVGAQTGFTLDDLGIERKWSAEWQKRAGKPKRQKKPKRPTKQTDADAEPSSSPQPVMEPAIEACAEQQRVTETGEPAPTSV